MLVGHSLVKDLPDSLRKALESVGYGRKDIAIESSETVSVQSAGGDGYRCFTILVDIASGERETHMGSWGGSNPFNRSNAVDLDDTERPIPPGGAVIKGSEGGSRPVFAVLHVSPANVTKLLPPASSAVSERDLAILYVFKHYKAFARKEYLDRYIGAAPSDLDSLVERKLLSRNKAGATAITTDGRNALAAAGVSYSFRYNGQYL